MDFKESKLIEYLTEFSLWYAQNVMLPEIYNNIQKIKDELSYD